MYFTKKYWKKKTHFASFFPSTFIKAGHTRIQYGKTAAKMKVIYTIYKLVLEIIHKM